MSRAGMAFKDGAVLGECLSRLPDSPTITKATPEFLDAKKHALSVFQKCRKERTKVVVERGNIQQYLYHLHVDQNNRKETVKCRWCLRQRVKLWLGEIQGWHLSCWAMTILQMLIATGIAYMKT
jgi:hypothetical protein